jgi:hypothetical protein
LSAAWRLPCVWPDFFSVGLRLLYGQPKAPVIPESTTHRISLIALEGRGAKLPP